MLINEKFEDIICFILCHIQMHEMYNNVLCSRKFESRSNLYNFRNLWMFLILIVHIIYFRKLGRN